LAVSVFFLLHCDQQSDLYECPFLFCVILLSAAFHFVIVAFSLIYGDTMCWFYSDFPITLLFL